MKIHFSTGVPGLDDRISGLRPGDTLLAICSTRAETEVLPEHAIRASLSARIPVVYLPLNDSLNHCFDTSQKVIRLVPTRAWKNPSAAAWLQGAIRKCPKHALFVTDDLSSWLEVFGSSARLLKWYLSLTEVIRKRESLLIASFVRTSCPPYDIAPFKDASDICLDLFRVNNETVCIPVQLKHRYLPGVTAPFRMRDARNVPPADGTAVPPIPGMLQDEMLSQVFQAAPQPMVLFDSRGDLREFNRKAEEFLGYERNEAGGLPVRSMVSPPDYPALLRLLVLSRNGLKSSGRITILRKNGRRVPVDILLSKLSRNYSIAILLDRSEREKSEEALVRTHEDTLSLLQRLPVAVCVTVGGQIRLANQSFWSLVGMPDSARTPGRTFRSFLPSGSARTYLDAVKQIGQVNDSIFVDLPLVKSDGSTIDCRMSLSRGVVGGEESVQHVVWDESGRRRLVTELATSEARLKTALQRSPQSVMFLDAGVVTSVNPAFIALFNFDAAEEITGKPAGSLAEPGDEDEFTAFLSQPLPAKKGGPPVKRFRLRRHDGRSFDADVAKFPAGEKNTDGILCFITDTTALDLAETDRRLHEDDLKILSEFLPGIGRTLDAGKIRHSLLTRMCDFLGWEFGALYLPGNSAGQLELVQHRNLPPLIAEKLPALDTAEGIGGLLAKTQEPHVYAAEKIPSHLPHRSLFRNAGIKELSLVPLLSGEQVTGALIGGTVHEGKSVRGSRRLLAAIGRHTGTMIATLTAYQTVKALHDQSEGILESSEEVLYSAQPNGTFISLNAAIEHLTGYTRKEFFRNPTLWLRLVHADDKRLLLDRTANIDVSGSKVAIEYRMLPKGKAAYRWVRDSVTLSRADNGSVTRLFGSIADVTEQRELLDNLRQEGLSSASILAAAPEGIAAFDTGLQCTAWNPAMEELTGIPAADAIGRRAPDIPLVLQTGEWSGFLRTAMSADGITSRESSLERTPDSSVRYVVERYAPLVIAGATSGVVGVFTDQSSWKNAEIQLRDSERILGNVIDSMGDLLVITDLRGGVVQVNRAFLETLGYSRSEALGARFPYPWLLDEEMPRFVEWIAGIRANNALHDFDTTWRTREGRTVPMSLSTTLLRNPLGEPIAMVNIARNITERMRLRNDLEQQSRQIGMINRIVSSANQTMDVDEIFGVVAREVRGIVPSTDLVSIGLPGSDPATLNVYALTGKNVFWRNTPVPLNRSVSSEVIRTGGPVLIGDMAVAGTQAERVSFESGIGSVLCLPIMLKGNIFGTLTLGSPETLAYSETDIALLQPVAQQIGAVLDRVRLVDQVTADAAYIHNLLDSINSIVYTTDTRNRIREVNRAWYEFVSEAGGTLVDDYHGKDLFEVLPDESLRGMIREVVGGLIDGTMPSFSREYLHTGRSGERMYQMTIVPMVVDGTVTGLVFQHTDITPVKQTEDELKRSNEQLLALNEISRQFSSSYDLDGMLRGAVPLLLQTVGADSVIVNIFEADSGDIVMLHQVGFDPGDLVFLQPVRRGLSVTGEAVLSHKPIFIPDRASQDPRIVPANREFLKRTGLNAVAIVPLVTKNEVIGALDIFYRHAHQFTPQEQQILILVGNQFGSSMENATLYGQLRAQIERLTVLYELSQELTATLNIDQIFQVVCEHLRSIVSFRRFTIELVDPHTRLISTAFSVENQEGELIANPVIVRPSPVPPGSPSERVLAAKESHRSLDRRQIIVPLVSKETTTGLLTVDAGLTVFSDAHQQILESVASLTAIALEKGKLYEETLQKSLEIQRRNKELDDFTYVVSHDLKEPLISIEGFSRILQLDYGNLIQADGHDYLDSIVGATTRMKGLIDDLLLLSRVSRPSESFRPVAIADVVSHVMTDLEFTIRQRGVVVRRPEQLPVVEGNETQLNIVFRNLIGNGIKFNRSASPAVEIAFQNAENNSYLFSIHDNGIGIEREFFDKIFVIFQRLHRREDYEGTGAGLAIVKKIIELHRGRIWVESEVGKGSTFLFTLPALPVHESRSQNG